MGYPCPFVGVGFPAFDLVSDYFRSLRGSTLDMFRQPDKLLAMIDVMLPASINLIIGACKATNTTRAFIPMHRGAGGFMSDEQFEKFYWPSFTALIYACIENGITPMPLFEGDYTPRLKYLATLPPGKVAAHMDKIDRKKFKEMCGDTMCFWGNVPPSLLATGTPQQVKDDVKELIDLFGDTGALIIDSTVGIPDEARPENVLALREAADEYGVL
jgi:uroporphyrinogen-III decarboxylase